MSTFSPYTHTSYPTQGAFGSSASARSEFDAIANSFASLPATFSIASGAFTMLGAFAFTGTLTGATTVTFPTSGTLVNSGGTIANATNAVTATNATNATNATYLAGGAAGVIPWQSGAGVTAFTAAGTAGQVLISGGATSPTWAAVTGTGSVVKAAAPTVTNGVYTGYQETINDLGTGAAFSPLYATAAIHKLVTNANTTITLDTPIAGLSMVIWVKYGGAHTITFAGGTLIKYASGAAPIATSALNKFDKYLVTCVDGTFSCVSDGGRNI